ncbi:hypothetical protein TNCV_3513411 [Trichonephila clavipes]|nr:hypothetical protein TNCV_3513411 [Trichonephila clavipes]
MNVAFLRCFRFNRFEILEVLDGSLLDAVASDSDREIEGRISVDSAANLLEVVGNKRVSVFKDEDEVFKLLPVKEVVVEVRMGIGNKASFCIVGNIADVEGMVTERNSGICEGVTINGQSKNTLADKNDFVCRADTVSISKSPDRNFLTDFGSPPIPFRAFE